ncbi:cystic fibrosis transmembrane conductance regulator-like [Tribolium madens]|uniref:cystic fibrosis transmembrane conductance regulator-like n=1 Tax=Tribolium madens TaxID=41895 RepID=UPI001CF7206B|nr:cystic fibrosis transmembrane conductance regulator-like [Tribolium madens]
MSCCPTPCCAPCCAPCCTPCCAPCCVPCCPPPCVYVPCVVPCCCPCPPPCCPSNGNGNGNGKKCCVSVRAAPAVSVCAPLRALLSPTLRVDALLSDLSTDLLSLLLPPIIDKEVVTRFESDKSDGKCFANLFVKRDWGKDLCELPENLKSKYLCEKLEKIWLELKPKKKKLSIIEPLLKCHFFTYFFLGLTQLIVKTSLIIGYPFLIDKFLESRSVFGFSLVALFLLETLYDQWYMFKLKLLQLQVESALCGLIYRKSLKLPQVHFGKILTFITKDCHNLNTSLRRANDVWIYILQSIFLIYLIFRKVGFTVLVPIIFFLGILVLQVRWALKSKILKTIMLETTESRFGFTQTVLSGIKSVKMNKWETVFGEKLCKIRSEEISLTHKIFLLKFLISSNATLWICASFFPWTAMYLNKMSLDAIFNLFQIYQILGHVLLTLVPLSVSQSAETLATIDRLDCFLQLGEVPIRVPVGASSAQIALTKVTVTLNRETVLRDINLDLGTGLHLVTGAVGSGKTSLLKTILREFEPITGQVLTQGSLTFSSQKPWIFASTIRQNILFEENFDEMRYNQVLQVCDLSFDLKKLGDLTPIQSSSLSKGQRARINLARAVYKNCDIYLLDDPLASLDHETKNLIFEKCASFLREKLVVWTAREMFDCPNCVVLDKGKIISVEKFETKIRNFDLFQEPKIEDTVDDASDEITQLLPKPEPLKFFFEEETRGGSVDFKIYKKWIQTTGFFLVFFVIFLVACLPLMVKIFDTSLISWKVELKERKNIIARHIALFMIYLIFIVISNVNFLIFIKKASIKLYKFLSQAVLNADLAFFSKNLSGQVLSRFSRDLLVLDEILPFLYYDSCKTLFSAIWAIVELILVQKIFLVAVTIFILSVTTLQKKFRSVATDVKRLEASAKSLIIDYFNSTLEGLTTIRAQNTNSVFYQEFENRLDLYTSASFTYMCTKRIFFISFNLVSSIFLGVVISRFLVVTSESLNIHFALHQSLFLIQILSEGLLKWSEFETHFNSVERILDYSYQKKTKFVLKNCPKIGENQVENVDLFVPNSKNVTFGDSRKEKIGIIDNSGSGKTDLIFTLIDPHGKLSSSGKISGFSEDPIFFQSTIRENVDPFGEHTNSEICDVLKALNFYRFFFLDLEEEIFDLSEGQKEIICLARLILDKSDIVIIDNPSVYFDLKHFLGRTVIIVSHDSRILEKCEKTILLLNGEAVLCVA